MSDSRESYVEWYVSEFGRQPIDSGYESDITWKAWQAAQAQAVNQQLLEGGKWDELVIEAAAYSNLFLEISDTDAIEFGRKLRELIAAAQEGE